MSPQEKTIIIDDDHPNMTTEEKNIQLSGNLAMAPCKNKKIIRIERKESESGWYIYHLSD